MGLMPPQRSPSHWTASRLEKETLFLIKGRRLVFTAMFGERSLFEFVRLYCAKSFQAFGDWFTVYTSGFREEDLQTVMEGYV